MSDLINNPNKRLYTLEDEMNPHSSPKHNIYPLTTFDQVFDNESTTKDSLRIVLDDLRRLIKNEGINRIKYPVTSVNNLQGDVILDKHKIGLHNVDNTSDDDKPLSNPQRLAIDDILRNFDFKINMSDFHNHINNYNNPHKLTFKDLCTGDEYFNQYLDNIITTHNYDEFAHPELRRLISKLWLIIENVNDETKGNVNRVNDLLNKHLFEINPHPEAFNKKEDVKNKSIAFTSEDNSYNEYSSTRAVVDFVTRELDSFRNTLTHVDDWIEDIGIVENRTELPDPSTCYRKAYFIRYGNGPQNELAISRLNDDKVTYSWDIITLGTFSKFNPQYFSVDSEGMSINIVGLIQSIIDEEGKLDVSSFDNLLSRYHTAEYIDEHFLTDIKLIRGTMDGHIRWMVNNDVTTISDDVPIVGLQQLAYMESITENEIEELAVHERHILNRAVSKRCIDDRAVDTHHINCTHNNIIGNIDNPGNRDAHEIEISILADIMRPYFKDPFNSTISPYKYQPGIEYDLGNDLFATRFEGYVTSIENHDVSIKLTSEITSKNVFLLDVNGNWEYKSSPIEIAMLGGTNITGYTFASIVAKEDGLYFESISDGVRTNAKFNVWIKYTKVVDTIVPGDVDYNYAPIKIDGIFIDESSFHVGFNDVEYFIYWMNAHRGILKTLIINSEQPLFVDCRYLFYNCLNLIECNLSDLNGSNVTDMVGMFKNCYKLSSVDLSNWSLINITNITDIFYECDNLVTVYCKSQADIDKIKNLSNCADSINFIIK